MQVFFLCCSAQVWSLPRYGCGRDYSLPAILEPFKARVFRALLASCRMTASGHGPSSPLRETMVGNGIKSGGSGREAPAAAFGWGAPHVSCLSDDGSAGGMPAPPSWAYPRNRRSGTTLRAAMPSAAWWTLRRSRSSRASERIPRFSQPGASRPAELGPALRRLAPLTCAFLPRSSTHWGCAKLPGQPKLCACETCRQRPQRSRDSRLGLDQLRRRTGRSPAQPTAHIPADLDRNRKGAPSPPRSNGQAFDEARNPVTVAGRRCRASGRVRPRWDQAFPCYSPLAWVVGAGPSAVPSGERPPAGGPALLG